MTNAERVIKEKIYFTNLWARWNADDKLMEICDEGKWGSPKIGTIATDEVIRDEYALRLWLDADHPYITPIEAWEMCRDLPTTLEKPEEK